MTKPVATLQAEKINSFPDPTQSGYHMDKILTDMKGEIQESVAAKPPIERRKNFRGRMQLV